MSYFVENIDSVDVAILRELQADASRSVQEIADVVGLSQNPCWRRIKRLESAGVIQHRVAILDPVRLGRRLTVFVSIRTNRHNDEWLERFAEGVARIPEIVEIHRMSGDVDYLLKVIVADIAEYDRIYKLLISAVDLSDVSSSFAMETIKSTTAIPLPQTAE